MQLICRTMMLGALSMGLLSNEAFADANWSMKFALKPTLLRTNVTYGTSAKPIKMGELVQGKELDAVDGVANPSFEFGRFEAELAYQFASGAHAVARVSGGRFGVKLRKQGDNFLGKTLSTDFGLNIVNKLSGDFSLETTLGARTLMMSFDEEALPSHGNMGVFVGVKPKCGGLSLLIENTLSAVPLNEPTDWGAQKDSSTLRVRPEYSFSAVTSGDFAFDVVVGFEMNHTHIEFFGSELVEGQTALMVDHLELAAVVGAGLSF